MTKHTFYFFLLKQELKARPRVREIVANLHPIFVLSQVFNIGRMTGLEPAHGGFTIHCLNRLATSTLKIYKISIRAK